MNGTAKYPPGEAPEAEARAEAELDRELRSDAAPLDIAVDEPEAEPASLARGAQAIKEFWRHAPLGPGVYRMIGEEGEVLYVGKARSIKKRIAAYMAPERQPTRIARMVSQTRSMVFVTTETEAEALLLEANLVRQLRPRYNVVLRDDKSFPYIHICTGHLAARIVKHRSNRNTPVDYFGHFSKRTFLLRSLFHNYYENGTRPCLL
jgi:excinuclease ABC subunit C